VEKRKKQLDGAKPYTIPVDRSQIIATGTWNDGKISENLTKFLIERGILTDAVATGPSHNPDGTAIISHPLVVCPIVHGWPKAPPSKRDFHRIYPSLEEMTWTRVALDIIGIPRSCYHRDSDYDVTFRLLTTLVDGKTAANMTLAETRPTSTMPATHSDSWVSTVVDLFIRLSDLT